MDRPAPPAATSMGQPPPGDALDRLVQALMSDTDGNGNERRSTQPSSSGGCNIERDDSVAEQSNEEGGTTINLQDISSSPLLVQQTQDTGDTSDAPPHHRGHRQ